MKKRPLGLIVYFILMLGIALSFPFQICIFQDISFFRVGEWSAQLTWLNLLVMSLMVISGFLAFTASQKIYIFAPTTLLFVVLNNWWVGHVGLNFSMLETALATFGYMLTTTPLLFGHARSAIRNQNIHWWRSAERRKVSLPVVIHPWVGESLTASTFDVSESGVFISLKDSNAIRVGDLMQMRFSVAGYIEIRCTARAVRKANSLGSYPNGVGMVFEEMSARDRKVLRELTAH